MRLLALYIISLCFSRHRGAWEAVGGAPQPDDDLLRSAQVAAAVMSSVTPRQITPLLFGFNCIISHSPEPITWPRQQNPGSPSQENKLCAATDTRPYCINHKQAVCVEQQCKSIADEEHLPTGKMTSAKLVHPRGASWWPCALLVQLRCRQCLRSPHAAVASSRLVTMRPLLSTWTYANSTAL
jgi:hypothetical protein